MKGLTIYVITLNTKSPLQRIVRRIFCTRLYYTKKVFYFSNIFLVFINQEQKKLRLSRCISTSFLNILASGFLSTCCRAPPGRSTVPSAWLTCSQGSIRKKKLPVFAFPLSEMTFSPLPRNTDIYALRALFTLIFPLLAHTRSCTLPSYFAFSLIVPISTFSSYIGCWDRSFNDSRKSGFLIVFHFCNVTEVAYTFLFNLHTIFLQVAKCFHN